MAVAQPLRDDSAITATVDSKQMNEIRHFIPLRDMLMLTSGAEFKMSAGNNSDAISPTSIAFDIQSYWGVSDVPRWFPEPVLLWSKTPERRCAICTIR